MATSTLYRKIQIKDEKSLANFAKALEKSSEQESFKKYNKDTEASLKKGLELLKSSMPS